MIPIDKRQLHWERQGDNLTLIFGIKTLAYVIPASGNALYQVAYRDGSYSAPAPLDITKNNAMSDALTELNRPKKQSK